MSYRIVEYYAENFKRLRLVQFQPKGRITAFTGKNDQGKTSALDAIPYVLGGKKWSPEMPKRRGAQHMKVKLDLGDLIVSRTESGLKVETAPGVKAWGTPQQMLDSLFDELAFDPMEFIRLKPDAQVDLLKRCVKLNEDLDELDRLNALDFETRRDLNREVARLDAELASIPVQEGLPAEKVDEAEIDGRIARANEHNRSMATIVEQRNRLQRELEKAREHRDRNAAFIGDTELRLQELAKLLRALQHQEEMGKQLVENLRPQLELLNDPAFFSAPGVKQSLQAAFVAAEGYTNAATTALAQADQEQGTSMAALEVATGQRGNLEAAVQDAAAALEAAPQPEVIDTTALFDELKQAQLVNREIDKRTRRDAVKKQRDEKNNQAEALTRAMRDRDERKARAIETAQMPLEGLSFTTSPRTEILFEGVPLQQLGEAKQIRISIALVLARNPKLRLVVIKHGEALDDDSMEQLQKMAEEQDFYVWMAKVDPTGKVGVYLEDGEVKAINEITPKKEDLPRD